MLAATSTESEEGFVGGTYMLNGAFVALAMMLALPLVSWRARRAGLARWPIIVRLAFVAWVAALVAVAFFPLPLPPYRMQGEAFGDYRGWPYPWLSPVPFETIRNSLEQGWNFPAGKYLVGNIGAFVPLGVLVPMMSPRWRTWSRALPLGLLASGLVEVTQLLGSLAMGYPWRVADVDDLMLNTLGTLIGFGIWTLAALPSSRGGRRPRRPDARAPRPRVGV
jgi:glycopeptide antibiotics resistance protein